MVDFNRPVYCLLGLPLDAVSREQAVQRLEQAREHGKRCFLSTPNLNFLVASQSDEDFRDSVGRSDLSVADGMPLIWLARLLKLPLRERVSGSDLFEALRRRSPQHWRVFFFGGAQGSGQAATLAVGQDETMQAVGHIYPGFVDVEQMSRPDLIDCINDSGAEILVVSLGAAKGQAWISRNLDRLHAPVISHLGAVVNFAAGTVHRAPGWMQHSGLEWLWRIKEEPQLWRRYIKDGMALTRLMVGRVLPLALLQGLQAPGAADVHQARVVWADGPQGDQVAHASLHGAWLAQNLSAVRQLFTDLYAKGTDVTLDLSHTRYLDGAACGLLLLLQTGLKDRGQTLHLLNPSRPLRRILRLQGVLQPRPN